MSNLKFALSAMMVFGFPSLLHASPTDIPIICEQAAAQAAAESGVPLDVLRAITLSETGRKRNNRFRPWPWTVNMEGAGKWFDSRAEAERFVDKHFQRGARSFDVGCFQINYRWHGKAFSSPKALFEPLDNARYAAKYLGELFEEFGDWKRAAGAYHSRTPKFATRYAARFERIRANLDPATDPSGPIKSNQIASPRANKSPLLVYTTAQPAKGSLVPLNQPSTRLISLLGAQPLSGGR